MVLKRDIASGLVVLIPILITLYVILWFYSTVTNVPLLRELVSPDLVQGNVAIAEFIQFLLTLVLFGALVILIGYLMRTAVGRIIETMIDDLINRIPGLRVVYNASKMAVETTLAEGSGLQAPVKVEPWDGMRMTAFKTGKRTADGRELIFMPTAPNITTGFVMEVDPDDLIEVDETVEEALTRTISAGFGDAKRDG